jgi:hypothetical protein
MYETDVIKELSSKDIKLSLVVSGGGVQVFNLFLVSGCSIVMTEAQFLYDLESYNRFFGYQPEIDYVSQEMSDLMALELNKKRVNTISIGVTCNLAKTRLLMGGEKAHISIVRDGKVIHGSKVEFTGIDRYWQDLEVAKYVFEKIVDTLKEKSSKTI